MLFKFTGYLVNKHFDPTEAESPVDVYRKWRSGNDDDPSLSNLRCWVQLKVVPDSSTVWMEVVLCIPDFFKRLQSLFEDGDAISIEFRIKGTPSPNSTPHPCLQKEDNTETEFYGIIETLQTQVVPSLSTMGLDDNRPSAPKGGGSGRDAPSREREVDLGSVVNEKDPFTMTDVQKIEDPIYMRFNKTGSRVNEDEEEFDSLCLSLDSLERYLRAESEKGKNMLQFELKRVLCKGGKERNFVITMQVWALSILRFSGTMSNSLHDFLECLILREEELQELKKSQGELYQRVLYWVSDMLDYKNSQGRLDTPTSDGMTPFMTPFYFSKEEVQSLGRLRMPNTSSLHTTIESLLVEKASGGAYEICTSHDLASVLVLAFEIQKGFHSNKNFKKDKKEWIKKREKEMKKK